MRKKHGSWINFKERATHPYSPSGSLRAARVGSKVENTVDVKSLVQELSLGSCLPGVGASDVVSGVLCSSSQKALSSEDLDDAFFDVSPARADCCYFLGNGTTDQ